jgi:hypothetical protein
MSKQPLSVVKLMSKLLSITVRACTPMSSMNCPTPSRKWHVSGLIIRTMRCPMRCRAQLREASICAWTTSMRRTRCSSFTRSSNAQFANLTSLQRIEGARAVHELRQCLRPLYSGTRAFTFLVVGSVVGAAMLHGKSMGLLVLRGEPRSPRALQGRHVGVAFPFRCWAFTFAAQLCSFTISCYTPLYLPTGSALRRRVGRLVLAMGGRFLRCLFHDTL